MTQSIGQTVFFNDLTPARVVSLSNVSGTYYNGPNNNGVGATLTIASSSLTIDGVLLYPGDRVLLQNQTSSYQNGVYIVQFVGLPYNTNTVVLQRAFDQQSVEQMKPGQFIVIGAGSDNAGTIFTMVEPIPQQIGVSPILFVSPSVLTTTVNLTYEQIQGMYATPIELLAAPGEGLMTVIDSIVWNMQYTSSAYSGGGAIIAQYGSTAEAGGVAASSSLAASNLTSLDAESIFTQNSTAVNTALTNVNNTAIYLSNGSAAFTAGTNANASLTIRYHLVAV